MIGYLKLSSPPDKLTTASKHFKNMLGRSVLNAYKMMQLKLTSQFFTLGVYYINND